jgi:predicted dehydrogenase
MTLYIKALKMVPGHIVSAVAAREMHRAEAFATLHTTDYQSPKAFDDYGALVNDPDVDIVTLSI